MTDEARETLKEEAIRALRGYLKTGLADARRKGLDRLHALGVDTRRCETTRQDIEHLIEFAAYW